jgi:hypothetical protein
MLMVPICLSSLDNDVSARQLLVVSNPLESLSWHPCRWDFGGWQKEAVGYNDNNKDNRRRV